MQGQINQIILKSFALCSSVTQPEIELNLLISEPIITSTVHNLVFDVLATGKEILRLTLHF